MKRPQMPIGELTFGQWKEKNFFRLLYWYLATNRNFDDWNLYCSLMFAAEQTEVTPS